MEHKETRGLSEDSVGNHRSKKEIARDRYTGRG